MLWIFVAVFLFSSCNGLRAPSPQAAEPECEISDLGFLLDVSNTLSGQPYHKAIKTIQGLVRAFNVRLRGSRAGLVTFSDESKTEIDFDRYPSHWQFNRAVSRLRKKGGGTRIDRGLDEATMVLYNQRYNWLGHKKYLFVFSDGMQTKYRTPYGKVKPNLKARTWLLRHQAVHIIAVAIGPTPDFFYLNQLVQYPEREVIVQSHRTTVQEMVKQIQNIACSKAPAVPIHCEKMADIAFLLDMSSSIGGPRPFKHETNFVKGVLDNYSSKKNQIRAGIIVYGSKATLKIKLNDYTMLEDFKNALDTKVKFRGSTQTRIDLALELANKELFTEANGDRPGVPNYLVLITDGKQNSGNWLFDHTFPQRSARPLWERNVTIFAVGVARASRRELRKVVGKTGKVIYKRKLRQLKEAVDLIIPSQCKGCHQKANIAFLLDSSDSLRPRFNMFKRIIYYIAEGFKQQRARLQASVVSFSQRAVVDIHFGDFYSLLSLQAELDTRVPFLGGRSFIDEGLKAVEREFDENAEEGLPKILIVITDGDQSEGNVKPVKAAANRLRKKGVHIVMLRVTGCRKFYCEKIAKAIADKPRYIIDWKRRDDIITTAERVARLACP